MEKRGAVVVAGPYCLVGVWGTFLCLWREASGLALSRSNLCFMCTEVLLGTRVSSGQRAGTEVVSVGRCLQRQTHLQGKFTSSPSPECIWNLGSLN